MKCDECGEDYRGSQGFTIKDMRLSKIMFHFCSWLCLKKYAWRH